MVSHAVVAMWEAAGRPEPDWQGKSRKPVTAPVSRDGTCALTGCSGPVFEFRHVVSDNFNGWDRMPFLTGNAGFSPAAAWLFRHRPAKLRPHALTGGVFREADPPALFGLLSRGLRPDELVVVPVSRQKHVAPYAAFGQVVTDDDTVPWRPQEARMLAWVARLRSLGFGETALAESSPRWPIIAKVVEAADVAWVMEVWDRLEPWRTRPACMDVACSATRKEKI